MMDFSQEINIFHGNYLPETGMVLAGYTAIINSCQLRVPLPQMLFAISKQNHNYKKGLWSILGNRYRPENTLVGQLTFALKYEGVNLSVLKSLFAIIDPDEIVKLQKNEPTSSYTRRIWFLYEWLMDVVLPISDLQPLQMVNIIDPKLQYPGPARISKRHRVRNNLPGVRGFCPLIFRTDKIDELIDTKLNSKITGLTSKIHADVLARAAAFLLLQDSKASYAIEGEHPPHTRAERWGRAIGQAGVNALTHEELLRLQEVVISDFRFIHYGYRNEGGFIGQHDRQTHHPIPQHISAKWQDIYYLMDSLLETNVLLSNSEFNPVLAATIISFGFVFIHPFEDGNGRLHRYLIHHVFAEMNFVPRGLVFPVSAVILEQIDYYRKVLELYSKSIIDLIEWRPTAKGNIEILNETADLYSYFDATPQAEFLFACTKETVEHTIPNEIDYLQKYDLMRQFIVNYVDMPDRSIELLINFLSQGQGKLSKRALAKEFSALTADEVNSLEAKYTEIFLE